jgi:hypothetical protein
MEYIHIPLRPTTYYERERYRDLIHPIATRRTAVLVACVI